MQGFPVAVAWTRTKAMSVFSGALREGLLVRWSRRACQLREVFGGTARGLRRSAHAASRLGRRGPPTAVSNPLAGLLYGAAVGVVLAVLWGGIAYLINRIFLWGAIGIGVALAWAINRGMEKVNLFGRMLTVFLTLATVIVGDYLFILFSAAKEVEGGLNLRLAVLVAQEFFEADFKHGSGYVSLLFALVGAAYILYVNRPPKFQVKYEPLG